MELSGKITVHRFKRRILSSRKALSGTLVKPFASIDSKVYIFQFLVNYGLSKKI